MPRRPCTHSRKAPCEVWGRDTLPKSTRATPGLLSAPRDPWKQCTVLGAGCGPAGGTKLLFWPQGTCRNAPSPTVVVLWSQGAPSHPVTPAAAEKRGRGTQSEAVGQVWTVLDNRSVGGRVVLPRGAALGSGHHGGNATTTKTHRPRLNPEALSLRPLQAARATVLLLWSLDPMAGSQLLSGGMSVIQPRRSGWEAAQRC